MFKTKVSENKMLTIGVFQLPICSVLKVNVYNAIVAITASKTKNPKLQLAILPESFNAPYGRDYFSKYAEQVPEGFTCQALSELAKKLGIYIIAGTIIERVEPDLLYNTCTIWSPAGKMIGKYRKVIQMFLYNVEAITQRPGKDLTIVNIENHKIGIGIRHDMRFDEFSRAYRNQGCDMLVFPSAFCICQGPMHWELLQRSRANDNQLFVVTSAPGRDTISGSVAYGHSMIADPWGRVQRVAGELREVIVEDIDFGLVDAVREQIPIFPQRCTDVYCTKMLKQ